MKILTLIYQPYPSMIGGSANVLLSESKYLQRNGHEMHIISARGGSNKLNMKNADKYSTIHRVGFPYIKLGKSRHVILLFKMLVWLIVNISFFITSFIKSLKLINEIEVISTKGIYADGLCAVLLKKIFKKKLVYEHAGGLNIKREKLFKSLKRGKYITKACLRFNTFIERIVYRNCDVILNQDNWESYYRNLGFKGDYYILPNGRDSEQYYPKDESALKKSYNIKGKIILFVGRLAPVKNIDKIMEAFELVPGDVSLVIVGDGELRDELHEKAKKGTKDIHFLGAHSNVTQFYNMADIVVLASDYEGFPGVLIEAMACGKVFVTPPVGVIPKIIINNVNGYLIPEKWTILDLANGMVKGLNAPESIKIKSKQTFDHNYASEIVIINKFNKAYQIK